MTWWPCVEGVKRAAKDTRGTGWRPREWGVTHSHPFLSTCGLSPVTGTLQPGRQAAIFPGETEGQGEQAGGQWGWL